MSEIKITNLPEKVDKLEDDDLLIIEDIEDTKKITLLRLKSAFSMDSILNSIKNALNEKIENFITEHSKKYKELVDRNSQLEIACSNLENDHKHDADRIFELENNLIIQQNIITDLNKEKNTLVESLQELQSSRNLLETELQDVIEQNNQNKKLINDLKEQTEQYKSNILELQSVNEELQNLADNLETEYNAKINNNFDEINAKLEEEINDLMNYIRHYHPDIDEIFKK